MMNRYKYEDHLSYCLGMSLSLEALLHKSEYVKEVILSSKANKNSQMQELLALCHKKNIPYREDDVLIEKLSLKENCYCIAFFEKYSCKPDSDKHILLYGFDDFGELGTVLRSGVAFDFHDYFLVSSDIDYFDPRCIRASMGSLFQCNIRRFDDLNAYLNQYPIYHLYPFVSSYQTEVSQIDFKPPYGIVICQNENDLNGRFEETYGIAHKNNSSISLSIRSSIILERAYFSNRKR